MTAEQLIKYLKENELDIQSAIASNLLMDLVFPIYANSEPIKGAILSPFFGYIRLMDHSVPFYEIISKDILFKLSKRTYLEYLKNPKGLIAKINKRSVYQKKMDKIWQGCEKNKNLSDLELLAAYKNMVEVAKQFWSLAMIGEDKYQIIDIEITPYFARRHNLDLVRAQEIITILSHPEKLGIFNTERKEFLNLCLAVLNSDINSDLKIKKYLKNYFWLRTDFYRAQEITTESILSEIKKEIKKKGRNGILKEIKKIDQNFAEIERKKKQILSSLKLTKKDNSDLKFVQLAVWWQDQRKAEMMKHFHYILRLVAEIAKRLNIDYDEAVACTLDEFEELLAGRKIKKHPQEIFVVYQKGKAPEFFYDETAKQLLETALKVKSVNEIKGMVASRGNSQIIKGIARIINNPLEDKFNKGEILVTSMTRVEFVPLMRKAKAIITDEGGIACHAAIVSRELGIPCIIGTKIATKVLRDGDLVEVDADKGIVKIIKN